MLDWMKSRGVTMSARPREAASSGQEAHANAGEYQLLYKYLRDRYANRVVLTFGEIEDLLGFSLPEHARVEETWWDGATPVGPRSVQSDAWTLAGRTATVNLAAKNVVFERDTAVDSLPQKR